MCAYMHICSLQPHVFYSGGFAYNALRESYLDSYSSDTYIWVCVSDSGWTRTNGIPLRRRLLFQLSYRAIDE